MTQDLQNSQYGPVGLWICCQAGTSMAEMLIWELSKDNERDRWIWDNDLDSKKSFAIPGNAVCHQCNQHPGHGLERTRRSSTLYSREDGDAFIVIAHHSRRIFALLREFWIRRRLMQYMQMRLVSLCCHWWFSLSPTRKSAIHEAWWNSDGLSLRCAGGLHPATCMYIKCARHTWHWLWQKLLLLHTGCFMPSHAFSSPNQLDHGMKTY